MAVGVPSRQNRTYFRSFSSFFVSKPTSKCVVATAHVFFKSKLFCFKANANDISLTYICCLTLSPRGKLNQFNRLFTFSVFKFMNIPEINWWKSTRIGKIIQNWGYISFKVKISAWHYSMCSSLSVWFLCSRTLTSGLSSDFRFEKLNIFIILKLWKGNAGAHAFWVFFLTRSAPVKGIRASSALGHVTYLYNEVKAPFHLCQSKSFRTQMFAYDPLYWFNTILVNYNKANSVLYYIVIWFYWVACCNRQEWITWCSMSIIAEE